MTINAYLVEVETRSIRRVTIDPANSLADIRRHIGCDLIDMVRIDRNHCIIVDDNGLLDEIPCFTEVKDCASPLAGNLLIVGTDRDGGTVSPSRPIEDFAAMLTIRFPVLSPKFETIDGPQVVVSRLSGFTVTLKGIKPVVIPTV